MPRKKTADPKLIALLDRKAKLQAVRERAYRRMRLAFNRLMVSTQSLELEEAASRCLMVGQHNQRKRCRQLLAKVVAAPVVGVPAMQECILSVSEELRQLGFTEGAPPHIPPAFVEADRRIYRQWRCALCGHRGQKVQPMHRGTEYRLVLTSRACHQESEA
jgi:hypothetical protein